MHSLFLYGPPGSGKSTLGKLLAERLGLPFLDLDKEVQNEAGMPVRRIFAEEGEAGFRAREKRALDSACRHERCVVALGGGTLLDAALPFRFGFRDVRIKGRDLLLNGIPIHLRACNIKTIGANAGMACAETAREVIVAAVIASISPPSFFTFSVVASLPPNCAWNSGVLSFMPRPGVSAAASVL